MKQILYFLLFGFLPIASYSQSSLHINAGWTSSNATVTRGATQVGPLAPTLFLEQFGLNPYLNLQYSYQHQKWSITTGFTWMRMGPKYLDLLSSRIDDYSRTYYLVPVLAGYQNPLGKASRIVFQGGVEMGLQNQSVNAFPNQLGMQANIAFGTTIAWKALQRGTRLHFGTMNVSGNPVIDFHHYGLTVFLGVRLWDEARCKARLSKG